MRFITILIHFLKIRKRKKKVLIDMAIDNLSHFIRRFNVCNLEKMKCCSKWWNKNAPLYYFEAWYKFRTFRNLISRFFLLENDIKFQSVRQTCRERTWRRVFDYARVRYSPRVMKFSAGSEQKVGFWLVCVELRHPHHQIQVTAIRIKRNM